MTTSTVTALLIVFGVLTLFLLGAFVADLLRRKPEWATPLTGAMAAVALAATFLGLAFMAGKG